MRRRWLFLVVLVGLVLSATPAAAVVGIVDPSAEPEVVLEPAEANKLAALQSLTFPILLSEVSPDDNAILAVASSAAAARVNFVDVNTAATTPVDLDFSQLPQFTEIGWRDATTAVYVSANEDFEPLLVSLDRLSGKVMTETLAIPGFPLSLAPNASRLLVALLFDDEALSTKPLKKSPFDLVVKRGGYKRVGPTKFDADQGDIRVSALQLGIASYDLNTKELVPLEIVPPGTGIVSQPMWTRDGSKVTFVRTAFFEAESGRGPGRTGDLLSEFIVQEALGNIPPQENPYLLGNVVDSFDIAARNFQPALLKAAEGNGDVFARVMWNPDGQTLMTQMWRPAQLTGRRYPTYTIPDRSYLRFYNAQGQQLGQLDRPEIEAPFTAYPQWIGGDEVVINAPTGLSYHLYFYNRVSGEFRKASIEEGTYYQVRPTQSGNLIYNFSSFQKPYELYRIQKNGIALFGLTRYNAEQAAINQIRADQVFFTLRNGQKRAGYILQPAGAAFPPRNARIVVWQQGGPGGTMTNEWGGNVEQPFNLLPNFGLAMLILPLPGREGWGPKFLNDLANGRNYGQIDIDEAAEAVQQMIRRGYTRQGSVGISGCSYGGYFSNQSITRHPNLYAAADAQCSLLDLNNEFQFGYTPFISYLMGRPPTADPEEYTRDSPYYNAVRVRTPLLLFHGTEDFLPVTITANYHDQIAAGKRPVVLLAFLDEGHGLGAPTSQFAAGQAQINWFRQYLGTGTARR